MITIEDVHRGYVDIDEKTPGVLICDIDGTLADITHRRHFVATKPKNWAAFETLAHKDTCFEHIASVVRLLYNNDWTILMVSGRGEQQREVTEKWLQDNDVPYKHLLMRAEKDYRADDIVKEEILNDILAAGYKPTLVLDDRDRVVAMWRRRGLKVVQVNFGDF